MGTAEPSKEKYHGSRAPGNYSFEKNQATQTQKSSSKKCGRSFAVAFALISLVGSLIVVRPDVQGIAVYAHILNWPPCSLDKPNYSAEKEGGAALIFRGVADMLGDVFESYLLPEWGGNIKLYSGVGHELQAWNVSAGPGLNGWRIAPRTASRTEGITTVLYLHGNGGNRATAHRVELYKVNIKSNLIVMNAFV